SAFTIIFLRSEVTRSSQCVWPTGSDALLEPASQLDLCLKLQQLHSFPWPSRKPSLINGIAALVRFATHQQIRANSPMNSSMWQRQTCCLLSLPHVERE